MDTLLAHVLAVVHNLATYLCYNICFLSTYVYYVITKISHLATKTPPDLPHPATMTPTALTLALATATLAFLPIAGQPTDDNLVCINNALAPILLKVTYDRANGVQNLWGLIADADRYLHHYGLAFVRPATRLAVYDPDIAEGASRVECTCAEAAWAARIQDYEAYEAAKAGVKAFIEAVVDDTWIRDLRDPETFYSNVTALALLNHLRDRSGGLHALDMVSLTIQMSQYYEGTPIIPEYIQLLEDAQRKAARAGLPVTNQT
jgi:hypothetical protein